MAQEPTYLTVEFYKDAGPYYSDALNKKPTEERMVEAGKDFKAALEQVGFRGAVDLSVAGQATVTNPDKRVAFLAKSLPYTTFGYAS